MHLFFTLAVDEQRARALPQLGTDSTTIHAGPSFSTSPPGTDSTAMHCDQPSSTPPPGPSAENSTRFSNSSGLADGGRKRKRSNETKVKKAQKGRHKTKKGSDTKKKPNKCRKATLRSDAEASATDSTSDDSDSGAGTQDEDSGEDDDTGEDDDNDDNEEVVPQTTTGKSTRNTSMDPRLWKGPVAPVNAVVDTTALASPSNASVLPSPPTTHSVPSLPVDPLVILPPPPSTVSGSVLATNPPPPPSSDKSPPSVIGAQDNSWPAWFTDAHRLLSSQNLGQEYTSLIHKFTEFEKRTAFAPGGRSAGFGSDNRPPEVRYWISRGRATQPKISNIADFRDNWWRWWKGLQPTWRDVSEVDGLLDRTHRPGSTGDHDWSAIDKHGRNAFFSVLATLLWWGAESTKPPVEDSSWMAAVEDVGWVLDGLLGVQ